MTQKETAKFIEDIKKHVQKKFPKVKSVPTRKMVEEQFGITRQGVALGIHTLYRLGVLKRKRETGREVSHALELEKNWRDKLPVDKSKKRQK